MKFEDAFAKRVANSADFTYRFAGDEALLDAMPGSHKPGKRQDGSNAPQFQRDKQSD